MSFDKFLLAVESCDLFQADNPIVIIGFSLQSVNVTGFPYNIHNLSL